MHYIQHVPVEGLGSIEPWGKDMAYEITSTRLFSQDPFPRLNDIDWFIIMGGPMGIYEEDNHPWLSKEKKIIEQAMTKGKIVLGNCLGAQIYPNKYKEIGCFPVQKTHHAAETRLADFLPEKIRDL